MRLPVLLSFNMDSLPPAPSPCSIRGSQMISSRGVLRRPMKFLLGVIGVLRLIFPGAEVDQAHHWYSAAAVLPGGHQNLVVGAPRQRER